MALNFVPERLTEARLSKGLNMADLGSLVNVSRQAISAFERGVDTPSYETILRFCNVLSLPREFFTNQVESNPTINGPIFFRSRKTTAKKDRAISAVKAIWLSRTFLEVARHLDIPAVKLPKFGIKDCESLTDEDIEGYALETRRFFNLGLGPISDMTRLLENHGIPVVSITSARKIGAYSFYSSSGHCFMTVDNAGATARTRFSLAHELGHMVLHQTLSKDFMEDKELFELVEAQANKFAGAFLLPAETFAREFFSPQIKAMIQLKQRWRVSLAMIAMRARALDLISDNQKVYIFRQLAPYRTREPLDDQLVPERPAYLRTALNVAEQSGLITKPDLRDKLQLPTSDLAEFFGIDEHEFWVKDNSVLNFSLRRAN